MTHGGPIRTLLCRFEGRPLREFHDLTVSNLSTFVLQKTETMLEMKRTSEVPDQRETALE